MEWIKRVPATRNDILTQSTIAMLLRNAIINRLLLFTYQSFCCLEFSQTVDIR